MQLLVVDVGVGLRVNIRPRQLVVVVQVLLLCGHLRLVQRHVQS